MKRIFFLVLVLVSSIAFAANQPVMSNNVVVKQNTTAAQCPPNWQGASVPYNISGATPYGSQSGTANQTVQSCTGCYFDARLKTCNCRVCYSYAN